VLAAAIFTAVHFGDFEVRRLSAQVDALEREKQQLRAFVERLSAARRVAQIDVVRQRPDDAGRPITSLLWQEVGPHGTFGKPLALEVVGRVVYFEAAVIKFEHERVGTGAEHGGASLAMFRRVFGDAQTPESAGSIAGLSRPAFADQPPDAFEIDLWKKFERFIDDPEFAKEYGIRIAQYEAPAVPLKAGEVWEISLDAAGGLNLRKIGRRSSLSPEPDFRVDRRGDNG